MGPLPAVLRRFPVWSHVSQMRSEKLFILDSPEDPAHSSCG